MTTYKDNRSFVLRGIDDVVYEERPIPHGTFPSPVVDVLDSDLGHLLSPVGEHEVLVEIMKTGMSTIHPELYSQTDPRLSKASVALMSVKLYFLMGVVSVLKRSIQIHYLAHGRIGEAFLHHYRASPDSGSCFSSQVITLSKNL